MQSLPREFNPFALMLDPQAVLAQIEHSERLDRLQRRVCRPLDKPVLGAVSEDGDDSAALAEASSLDSSTRPDEAAGQA